MATLFCSFSSSSLTCISRTVAVLQHREERISYALGCCHASFLCISSRTVWEIAVWVPIPTAINCPHSFVQSLYTQYSGILDLCARNKKWYQSYCTWFLPNLSFLNYRVFSWKGRQVGGNFLIHCDNLTLHRQKQNPLRDWRTRVRHSDSFFK